VVLGDGNFEIFAFAYKVQRSQRPMIPRLSQARAQKILGSTDRKGGLAGEPLGSRRARSCRNRHRSRDE
jgi:hypothetical protein